MFEIPYTPTIMNCCIFKTTLNKSVSLYFANKYEFKAQYYISKSNLKKLLTLDFIHKHNFKS